MSYFEGISLMKEKETKTVSENLQKGVDEVFSLTYNYYKLAFEAVLDVFRFSKRNIATQLSTYKSSIISTINSLDSSEMENVMKFMEIPKLQTHNIKSAYNVNYGDNAKFEKLLDSVNNLREDAFVKLDTILTKDEKDDLIVHTIELLNFVSTVNTSGVVTESEVTRWGYRRPPSLHFQLINGYTNGSKILPTLIEKAQQHGDSYNKYSYSFNNKGGYHIANNLNVHLNQFIVDYVVKFVNDNDGLGHLANKLPITSIPNLDFMKYAIDFATTAIKESNNSSHNTSVIENFLEKDKSNFSGFLHYRNSQIKLSIFDEVSYLFPHIKDELGYKYSGKTCLITTPRFSKLGLASFTLLDSTTFDLIMSINDQNANEYSRTYSNKSLSPITIVAGDPDSITSINVFKFMMEEKFLFTDEVKRKVNLFQFVSEPGELLKNALGEQPYLFFDKDRRLKVNSILAAARLIVAIDGVKNNFNDNIYNLISFYNPQYFKGENKSYDVNTDEFRINIVNQFIDDNMENLRSALLYLGEVGVDQDRLTDFATQHLLNNENILKIKEEMGDKWPIKFS